MTSINSFIKWEQAFRVFSSIYTAFHPARAGELIQYNHIIHSASQMFAWENIYRYDREFRIHMSRHHMNRSWAVILQQVWSMFSKDKVSYNHTPGTSRWNNHSNNGQQGSSTQRKLCFDFNRGMCSYGKRCKFEHRCSFCNKFGHGSFNCRKAARATSTQVVLHIQNNLHDGNDRWERYEQQQVKNINNNNNTSGGQKDKKS